MLLQIHKLHGVTGKTCLFPSFAIFSNIGSMKKQSYLKLGYFSLVYKRKLFSLNQIQNSMQLRIGGGDEFLVLTKKVL